MGRRWGRVLTRVIRLLSVVLAELRRLLRVWCVVGLLWAGRRRNRLLGRCLLRGVRGVLLAVHLLRRCLSAVKLV